jgi:tetratricopeptide (TPR) repeat protein
LVRRHRAVFCVAILVLTLLPQAIAGITRDEVLNQGLRNNEPYSYLMVEKAEDAPEAEKTALLEDALAMSPDTPSFYFEKARARLPHVFKSLNYALEGIRAYARNFYWTLSLAGLLYVSLMLSLIIALAVVVLIRFPLHLPLLAHDLSESKAKLLLIVMVLPLALMGPVAFLAGMLFLTGFHMKRRGKAVFYLAVVLMLFSPLFQGLADTFFSSPSPVMRAVVSVNEGRENLFAVQTLEGRDGFAQRFSYATALKREGRAEEAVGIFVELAKEYPLPMVYNNLGNAYLAAGLREEAKAAYENALKMERPAVPLYNLSQLYRDELNYQVGDKYYEEAVGLDRELVTSFTGIAGKSPNRLVVDETLGQKEFWVMAGSMRKGTVTVFTSSPLMVTSAAALLLVVFVLADKSMATRAFRCTRCGRVVCDKCGGGKMLQGNICPDCYRTQTGGEEDSPRTRVARMLQAGKYKSKQVDAVRGLSFSPPGIAQIYSGRALSGFVYAWLFLFALISMVLNPLFSTGMAGYSHWWIAAPAVLLMVFLYYLSFVTVNRRLDRGWL